MAFSFLKSQLNDKNTHVRIKALLLDILAEGGGIENIVKAGYEFLGNPIHVCDNSHMLIAHYGKTPDDEPIWNMVQTLGFPPMPDFPINSLPLPDESKYKKSYSKLRYGFARIRQADKPCIINNTILNHRLMGKSIKHMNKTFGSIYILESNKVFDENDSELLTIISEVLSYLMAFDDSSKNMKGEAYEYLLNQLFTHPEMDKAVIYDRVNANMLNLKKNFAVLTVSDIYSRGSRTMQAFRDIVEETFLYCKTTIFSNNLAVLLHWDNEHPLSDYKKTDLEKHLKNFHLVAGLSNSFTDISLIHQAYKQTLKAIYYGQYIRSDQVFFEYSDYLHYHFLDISCKRNSLLSYCDPGLIKLMEYDMEYNTEYAKTLNCYLNSLGNVTKAAASLNIHYNTMKFRMKKILELLCIEETDQQRFFLLYLSFRILELLDNNLYRLCVNESVERRRGISGKQNKSFNI